MEIAVGRVQADPALESLLQPFATGALKWPAGGRVLFLGARAGSALPDSAKQWTCEQSFRPRADALSQAGISCSPDVDAMAGFPLVLVLPTRQRTQSRTLMARAVAAAGDTGTVVVSQTNEEGARSAQADLASLCGPLHVGTGNHCRVFWSLASTRRKDPQLCDAWEKLDAPRPIGDGRFISRPGVFAWDRIDPASALLADCLPRELSGRGADLGAGFGMLSVELIERCAGVTSLDLFEADARALALCEVNLAAANLRRTGGPVPSQLHWHDVTRGVPGSYDFIVSNPPFHETRKDDPSLGRAFIVRAAQSLRPGGSLWLVANRHLPYEPTLAANFSSVREVRVQHGFKVLHATRGER